MARVALRWSGNGRSGIILHKIMTQRKTIMLRTLANIHSYSTSTTARQVTTQTTMTQAHECTVPMHRSWRCSQAERAPVEMLISSRARARFQIHLGSLSSPADRPVVAVVVQNQILVRKTGFTQILWRTILCEIRSDSK